MTDGRMKLNNRFSADSTSSRGFGRLQRCFKRERERERGRKRERQRERERESVCVFSEVSRELLVDSRKLSQDNEKGSGIVRFVWPVSVHVMFSPLLAPQKPKFIS